jgi:hypothetical protein
MFNFTRFNILTINTGDSFYLNKNIFNIKNNLNTLFIKKQKTFNIKISKYFIFFVKNNYKDRLLFINNNANTFRNAHFNFNKNFINLFSNLTLKKNNFLILDNTYSHIFPLYKFIFGLSSLYAYKSFFFLKPIYFTQKSWSYFFLKFCYFNNISLLFIADYDYYISFYKNIIEFDYSVSAIVPSTYSDSFVDYPLYAPFINTVVKLSYISLLTTLYFQSFNHINYYYKYNYINYFFKYSNSVNKLL